MNEINELADAKRATWLIDMYIVVAAYVRCFGLGSMSRYPAGSKPLEENSGAFRLWNKIAIINVSYNK